MAVTSAIAVQHVATKATKGKIKQLVVSNVFAIVIVATFVVNVHFHLHVVVIVIVIVAATAAVVVDDVRKYFNTISLCTFLFTLQLVLMLVHNLSVCVSTYVFPIACEWVYAIVCIYLSMLFQVIRLYLLKRKKHNTPKQKFMP